MNENLEKYKIGEIYLCKVISITKNSFEVLTPDKDKGIVYIKEISDYFVSDLNDLIKINDIYYLTLKEIRKNNQLVFSFKENKSYFLKTPFDFEISEDTNKKDFKNLLNFTNERIKGWKK